MVDDYEIDKVDLDILNILLQDAWTPFSEIAKKIYVSGGTVHVRINKLKKLGILKGATLEIDSSKVGYDITAFIGVFLQKGSIYQYVINQIKEIPEITEAYYTTGNYSIFLKMMCKNTSHLREVLNDKLQSIDGIERTDTILSLEQSIRRTVPLA